jgi:hypothetical protein
VTAKRVKMTYRVVGSFVVMIAGITATIFGRFLGNPLFLYPGIALLILGTVAFAAFMVQRAVVRHRKYGRRHPSSSASAPRNNSRP